MNFQDSALVVAIVLVGVVIINLVLVGLLRGGRKIDILYYRTLFRALRDAPRSLRRQYDDLDELSRRVQALKSGESDREDAR
jgi:hypothetical protein